MMELKLSSSRILTFVVGLFILLLSGILIFSLKLMNSKYDDYKLGIISSSPYETNARITDKYALGGGFEIEYQFRGKVYGEVMKVKNEIYRKYSKGDKIPITLALNQPLLVVLSSDLRTYAIRKP